MFLMLCSINGPKFHFLNAFTSWNIGKYVHCSCLFHKFWNQYDLSIQTVFINDHKVKTKTLKVKQKAFIAILKGLSVAKILSDLRVPLAAFGKLLRQSMLLSSYLQWLGKESALQNTCSDQIFGNFSTMCKLERAPSWTLYWFVFWSTVWEQSFWEHCFSEMLMDKCFRKFKQSLF